MNRKDELEQLIERQRLILIAEVHDLNELPINEIKQLEKVSNVVVQLASLVNEYQTIAHTGMKKVNLFSNI